MQGFLEQINYVDGALVKKDSVLFVIQRNTYEAQLAQAKATLAGNQAAQLNAQIEYDRQAQLQQQQVATQAKLDDAKPKLDQAIAGVDSAKANLEIAQINLGYTEVAAPFDGIATRHLVNVGALVGYAGPTKLATIVQVDPIYVYFNISETMVLRIKEGLAKQGKTLRDVHEVPVEIGTQTEERIPSQGQARLRRAASRPVHRHARGARRFSTTRTSLCCRDYSCACAFPCNASTRESWSRIPRSAPTSSANTCSSSARTTRSSSGR